MSFFSLDFLWIVAYGFVAGVLAKIVFPDEDSGGVLVTAGLGITGSIIGGAVFRFFGFHIEKGLSLWGLAPAVVGAFLILFLWRVVVKLLSK